MWPHRTRPVEACMRRLLQQVLSKEFIKVHSYGLLSLRCRPALAQSWALAGRVYVASQVKEIKEPLHLPPEDVWYPPSQIL